MLLGRAGESPAACVTLQSVQMRVVGSLSLSLSLPVFSAVCFHLKLFYPFCVLCCSLLFSLYRFVFWDVF